MEGDVKVVTRSGDERPIARMDLEDGRSAIFDRDTWLRVGGGVDVLEGLHEFLVVMLRGIV